MIKRVFSGVQPTGFLHLGNYLGAVKQWVNLQSEADEAIFCVVDLHAITVPQVPEKLKENILSITAAYLAAGIDPKKSAIFVQSARSEHSELAWILNCQTTVGELNRMTQYKDKGLANQDKNGVGLFDYPVLMAADILLYQTTLVPVGDDQKQHIELTRDLAERFNKKYSQVFTIPEPYIKKTSARIMGLDDPSKKMSKSAFSDLNYISLLDFPDQVSKKIKRAVTDSDNTIQAIVEKPAISNLINIFAEVTGKSVADIENTYKNEDNYGRFKNDLTVAINQFLAPFQKKYYQYLKDPALLVGILDAGSKKVAPIAQKTLAEAKKAIGLYC